MLEMYGTYLKHLIETIFLYIYFWALHNRNVLDLEILAKSLFSIYLHFAMENQLIYKRKFDSNTVIM